MTREEVLAILHTMEYELSNQVGSTYCRKKHDAVGFAIKALEKLDKVEQISQRRNDGYYEQGTYREGNHWQILDEIEEVMYEDRDSN